MAGASRVRGARIGSGPGGEPMRGELAPRVQVSYWCAQGHETQRVFSAAEAVEVPTEWTCIRCGEPAGQDAEEPPGSVQNVPFKTHLAYVLERRSASEGEELLGEALSALRARRSPRQTK